MAGTDKKSRTSATGGKYYDAYRNFDEYYSQTSSAYKVDRESDRSETGYTDSRRRMEKAREQVQRIRDNARPIEDDILQRPNRPRKSNNAAKPKPAKPKVAKPKTAKRQRTRLNVIYFRNRIDPAKNNPIEAYIAFIFLALGLFCIVGSHAMVQEARVTNTRLRTQLAETRTHSAALHTELYENFDKDEIERIAMAEFDMTYPKPHQEIRVSVPKASYVVQVKQNTMPETHTWLYEKMVELVSRTR